MRYAAVVGLQSLAKTLATTQPKLVPEITAKFQEVMQTDSELVMRARAQLAWQQIN